MYGEHFQFPDTDPCEIVDIEATFHLSYEDNEGNRQVGLTYMEHDYCKFGNFCEVFIFAKLLRSFEKNKTLAISRNHSAVY